MATSGQMPATVQNLSILLERLGSEDPDFRYMSLNDMLTMLETGKPDFLEKDYNTGARTVDNLVKALDDKHGEVQNLAIKCLGPITERIHEDLMGPLLEKLATMEPTNSIDRTVPALGLRAVIASLPHPMPGALPFPEKAKTAINAIHIVLIPNLLGRLVQPRDKPRALPEFKKGILHQDIVTVEAVDVLIELVRCFGPMFLPQPIPPNLSEENKARREREEQQRQADLQALYKCITEIIYSHQVAFTIKKRAVVALSQLSAYTEDKELEDKFINEEALKEARASQPMQRLYASIFGSMARSIPHRFGRYLGFVAPFILDSLGEDDLKEHLGLIADGADVGTEFNDVREASLIALESFLSACPVEMRQFTERTITDTLRYLKYDPNCAMDEDEDDGDEDMDEDEDFDGLDDDEEYEAYGFDDDDDGSWKVRRCAAKVLHTLIATRSNGDLLENGVLYKVAGSLVKRLDDREESVRLEIISALSLLVRKSGQGVIPDFSLDAGLAGSDLSQLPPSRKRRRQSSAAGLSGFSLAPGSSGSGTGLVSPVLEKVPATGPRADLAKLTPSIVKLGTKLFKGKLLSTKQAVISLLDDIIKIQSGGLSAYLDQIMEPILEAIKPSTVSGTSGTLLTTGGNASATPITLRVAALRLMSNIAKTHSSQLLQPYLTKIVACVVAVVKDRFYKISIEAVQTAEEVVKAITPPRSRMSANKYKGELGKLYDVLLDRISAQDADTEVKQKAIHALGTLLSRTATEAGAELLPASERARALRYLRDRLTNETTRLSSVRAIDKVAASASSQVEFESDWVQEVVVELSAQLRKANRALRGSSVQALSHLTHSPAVRAHLLDATIVTLVTALQPVIANNDAHLLGPALHVIADLAQKNAKLVVTSQTITIICELLRSSTAASVLDALLHFVTSAGQSGAGGPLMEKILNVVGIDGDPVVIGKVIGNLLVASGPSAGVTLDNFIAELANASGKDPVRASLALAVLGEAGLRLGPQSQLKPDIFLDQFGTDFDKASIAAAIALGRAGAGNVEQYLPVILKDVEQTGTRQYLLLQSIKEILQQAAMSGIDISSWAQSIWSHLLRATEAEDNKAVCAECIGRLAIIYSQTFVPMLQNLLQDKSTSLRAIAVQALRYTLPENSDVFDALIKERLVSMLLLVLQDPELEIRRLALTALNSAAHNKPDLILGQLHQLLPYVMKESVKNQALVREVTMGPFKHLVDDGLEVRKSAYETLYALMETAFPRLDVMQLYNRIIDGLSDDNDIRGLCNLMISKLLFLAPDETMRRLENMAVAFRRTLSTKLKENPVKQEIEKQNEAIKSVLRVSLLLDEKLKAMTKESIGPVVVNEAWKVYWEGVSQQFGSALKELRDETVRLEQASGGGQYIA